MPPPQPRRMVGGGFAVLQQHRVAKTAQRIVKPCSSIALELELNWSSPTRVEFGIRVLRTKRPSFAAASLGSQYEVGRES